MKLQIGQRDQHGAAVFLEFLQHLSPPREPPARPRCCPGSSAVVQCRRPTCHFLLAIKYVAKKTKWKCWKIVVWMRVVFNYGKTPRPWFIVVINKEIKMLLWPALEQDLSVSPLGRYCLIKEHKVICQQNEKSKLIAKIYIYRNILIRLLCAQCTDCRQLPRAGKVSLIKICCMPANFVAAPCCQY